MAAGMRPSLRPAPARARAAPTAPRRPRRPSCRPAPPRAAADGAGADLDVFSPSFARALRLDARTMAALAELPGTTGPASLADRARTLAGWRTTLGRGALPDPAAGDWPDPALARPLVAALADLGMPRFTARHPGLLDALLRQVLDLVREYEERMAAEGERDDAAAPDGEDEPPPPDSGAPVAGTGAGAIGGDASPDEEEGGGESTGDGASGDGADPGGAAATADGADVSGAPPTSRPAGASPSTPASPADVAASIASDLVADLVADWRDAATALAAADAAFDGGDLASLVDGPSGFDAASATWTDAGWTEVASLTRVLAACRELRDLVRSLGRAAGRGPLRRAPAQVATTRGAPGVLRSPLQPEETSGLARSGDLGRMLPSEAHLVAAGWPRGRGTRSDDGDGPLITGSRAARLLHMARRAERTLLSYERDGWLDDASTRATARSEIRPAAELGPIIVCLDTSGSMAGARETVAKAVALECMRSAHRARRRALLYAFSGPGDVRALELAPTPAALADLLAFLRCTFGGGTDADAPLALALDAVEGGGWADADVLMVTDGELPPPSPATAARLDDAKATLGLRVHGLLVGREGVASPGVEAVCSDVHFFRSWGAVRAAEREGWGA